MTDRIRLDDLTSADLDQLYRERDRLRRFATIVARELNNWDDRVSPDYIAFELRDLGYW
ncbi:hypothetical protein ABZ419_11265 [Streptomyces cinnamoneus]|uniref:hypothetical protein n=1 Tax=Streptomyces cinnamoneus TaxID=53446 RepID=UPI0033FA0011